MNFIVKISKGGSSRIGVHYVNEYQAIKTYEEILQKELEFSFTARIELFQQTLNLQICSSASGKKFDYQQLSYSVQQIQHLLQALEKGYTFHFYHIYSKSNILTVAKPFRKNTFITLSTITILNPVNL